MRNVNNRRESSSFRDAILPAFMLGFRHVDMLNFRQCDVKHFMNASNERTNERWQIF